MPRTGIDNTPMVDVHAGSERCGPDAKMEQGAAEPTRRCTMQRPALTPTPWRCLEPTPPNDEGERAKRPSNASAAHLNLARPPNLHRNKRATPELAKRYRLGNRCRSTALAQSASNKKITISALGHWPRPHRAPQATRQHQQMARLTALPTSGGQDTNAERN